MKHPDPKMHLHISLLKSAFRIIAGVTLMMGLPVVCGALLIVAELLGVFEELV